MTVYETDVPGVGRKFELELADGSRAVVLHHHDGRRELFRRPDPEADSEQVFDLPAEQARRLGSILLGSHFESVDAGALSVPLGESIIEWTEVPSGSPLAGETIPGAKVRGETGAAVVAIQRGTDTIANPGDDLPVETGDVLVALGTRAQQRSLDRLVAGDIEFGDPDTEGEVADPDAESEASDSNADGPDTPE